MVSAKQNPPQLSSFKIIILFSFFTWDQYALTYMESDVPKEEPDLCRVCEGREAEI